MAANGATSLAGKTSPLELPQELVDHIVDQLRDDAPALKNIIIGLQELESAQFIPFVPYHGIGAEGFRPISPQYPQQHKDMFLRQHALLHRL